MLQCETISPAALTAADRDAWISLAQATGLASPLLHPDFAIAVAKVRDDVRVALYRDRKGLAGVFAYHRRPGGFARPIGAAFSDLHAILTRPDIDQPVAELLRLAGISRARFPAVYTGNAASPEGMEPVGPSQATILRSTPEALIEELRGDAVREAFADKFGIDLTDRPTTFTLRGMSREKDGRIHTDSKTKLITVLIYLNRDWQDGAEGGRLRMLRSSSDLEDYVAEVPPGFGTMVEVALRAAFG